MTSDLTSPMLATWLCSSRPSTNRLPASNSTGDLEAENSACSLGGVRATALVPRAARQTCVVDLLDLVAGGEYSATACAFCVALDAQAQRLQACDCSQALNGATALPRSRSSCTRALRMYDRFAPNCEAHAEVAGIYQPVVAGVGLPLVRESLGILRVVERAAVDDHAGNQQCRARRCTSSPVDDDVGAPLQRLDQVRRGHCVVHDQRYPELVGHPAIASMSRMSFFSWDALPEERLRVGLDSRPPRLDVVGFSTNDTSMPSFGSVWWNKL